MTTACSYRRYCTPCENDRLTSDGEIHRSKWRYIAEQCSSKFKSSSHLTIQACFFVINSPRLLPGFPHIKTSSRIAYNNGVCEFVYPFIELRTLLYLLDLLYCCRRESESAAAAIADNFYRLPIDSAAGKQFITGWSDGECDNMFTSYYVCFCSALLHALSARHVS